MPETEVIACPDCGAANRVPQEKLNHGLVPRCGRCKAPLSGPARPITLTDSSFQELVGLSPLPVLIDMWAPWCGPCRMIGPLVEELATEYSGRVRITKMNVDENPATSQRLGIQSIPALLIFQGGAEVDRLIGAQPKTEIVRHLQRFL